MIFTKKKDYLLAEISDDVITFERAKEIFTKLGEECSKVNCQKVLLDERSVERRAIEPHQIMKLSQYMADNNNAVEIDIAFLCKEHLINKNTKRLGLFSYKNRYIMKHFSKKNEALEWLKSKKNDYF